MDQYLKDSVKTSISESTLLKLLFAGYDSLLSYILLGDPNSLP